MALLDQLHIQGIRNFPSDRKRVVRFQNPLTLIVGENGCGKTTVIECIKFALINELPQGASSGKNFVHDPRIDNKDETHAIVKLQCMLANNDAVCVMRTLLLTLKNNKETCASKDTTISKKNAITGEQRNLGCLQAESVVEMCNMMGVSKAIVNNVIFCHQENADWPLDEGKKVKEIFDEIFDATKYNKALDLLRLQQDRLKKDLPALKVKFSAAKNFKTEADGKKQRIYDETEKREQCLEELKIIRDRFKPLEDELSELSKKQKNMALMDTQYHTKKTERDMEVKNLKVLQSSIKELFTGDKSELQSKLNLFRVSVDEKKSNLENQEDMKKKYIHEEKQLQSQISESQMKLGKLERDEETQRKHNDSLKTYLNNLVDVLALDVSAKSQYTQEEGEGLIRKSQDVIQNHLSDITILERTFVEEENTKQRQIDSLRETKASIESEVKSLNQQIGYNKRELTNVISQINEVNQSQSTLQLLQTKLNRVNSEIEQLSKNLDPEKLKTEIESWKTQRNDLEDETAALDNDIAILQAQTITLAEIKSLNNRKQLKLTDIERMKEKHNETFLSLFNAIPEDNYKSSLDQALSSTRYKINRIQDDINTKEKQLYTLVADEKNLDKSWKEKKSNLTELLDRMEVVLGSKDFEDELERVTKELKREQEHVSMMTSTEYMFHRYIDKLQATDPRCPLCKRFFEPDYSVPALVSELKSKIEKIPAETTAGKSKVEHLCKLQSSLQELRPVYESITKLQEIEIPSLRNKLSEVGEAVRQTRGELKDLKNELQTPKEKEQLALSIQGDITLLDQHIKDFKSLQRDLERQETNVSGIKVTEGDLENKLRIQKERNVELNMLRSKIENGQNQLSNHNEKLQSLQRQKNEIHSKQLTVQGGAGMLKSLEDRKSELEGVDSLFQTELEELNQKIAPIETQLHMAINELETLKKEHGKTLSKERSKIQDYTRQLEDVKRMKQEVENFARRGTSTQLADVRATLHKLNQNKEDILAKRNECETVIAELNRFIANQNMEEMDLKKNLDLIDKKQHVAILNEEVESLHKDMNHLDRNTVRDEIERVYKEQQRLMKEKARIDGKLEEIHQTIKITENELKKEYLRNADENYLRYAYEMKLNEIFQADLNKYRGTLQNCVIQYHRQKMESVNHLIRDYWSRVYQGNDIEYIRVEADLATQTEKRTAFTGYRVIMMKNNTPQDMRNRCSAGQRVLACLIIRLALAETFSRNCGIFALDEPTTNLDSKNAVSLSKALALLVEEKQDQKNFQLIVITHDEEFIENLTAIDKAYVVRIVRDQNGLSNVQYPENMVSNEMEEEKVEVKVKGVKRARRN